MLLKQKHDFWENSRADLLRGSLGPSTVTLIALIYVATWGGSVFTVMVIVNVLPVSKQKKNK